MWPRTEADLVAEQGRLADLAPQPFALEGAAAMAGCFVCFDRGGTGPGAAGDPGWAAAAVVRGRRVIAAAQVTGAAAAPYRAGLLALREGPILEAAVRALDRTPEVLLVNATGRDHPRRCGLAVHLGARLGVATVGVTNRTLLAEGDPPGPERGDRSPLTVGEDVVGTWLRTRSGAHPVAVHAGWRTDAATAAEIVLRATARARTPEPLRRARTLARLSRSGAAGPDAGFGDM